MKKILVTGANGQMAMLAGYYIKDKEGDLELD